MNPPHAHPQSAFETALQHTYRTIKATIPRMGSDRPCLGRPDLTYARCTQDDWVEGFWSGQLWLAYANTKDPIFKDAARHQRAYFLERLHRPHTHDHDLGFLYQLSLVADYKLTGSELARDGALRAADFLASRYNARGRYIRAWDNWPQQMNEGRIIIDTMMNLALLYWAWDTTDQSRYRDIAAAHATTSAQFLLRADHSTFHTYLFDPETGNPIGGETHQGFAHHSCWSRGQAWALYGFALTYIYTEDAYFLRVSQQAADYILKHLPPDYVPYWDYMLPDGEMPYRDSSAAAITVAGLFLLAELLPGYDDCYKDTAFQILHALIQHYTTFSYPMAEGLLLHGAAHVPQQLVDNMLPYGDYFFLEALLRAKDWQEFFW